MNTNTGPPGRFCPFFPKNSRVVGTDFLKSPEHLTFKDFFFLNNFPPPTAAVVVKDDNKAALLVALDRRDKDYYACDAGCVDPPARLSTKCVVILD